MAELLWHHYLLIALIFVWSGFVRSGLGFGGAALSLPFLLLIDNNPLIFLPIIAIHLLIFSSSTVLVSAWKNQKTEVKKKPSVKTLIGVIYATPL